MMYVQVVCEPGDLLLWDSRLIHCNQSIDRQAAGAREELGGRMLARLVAFVCMLPRARLDGLEQPQRDALASRRERFVREGHTGPHHPLKIPEPVLAKAGEGFWGHRQNYTQQQLGAGGPPAPPAYEPPGPESPIWRLV